MAILDADKEGFLRSASSLIQTMGRAARNVDGSVVLYADTITDSMREAVSVTQQRRARQIAYNLEHGIDPQTHPQGGDRHPRAPAGAGRRVGQRQAQPGRGPLPPRRPGTAGAGRAAGAGGVLPR